MVSEQHLEYNKCQYPIEASDDPLDTLIWGATLTDTLQNHIVNALSGCVEIHDDGFTCLVEVDDKTYQLIARLVVDVRYMRKTKTQPFNPTYIEHICNEISACMKSDSN